jgi:hypothetical protein
MSFLTESAVRRVAMLPRAIAITAPRPFTTSLRVQKTATETIKDSAKAVDRAVSDKLVDGIDAATSAAEKVKQSTEHVAKNDVAAKAQELKAKAAGKASELEGEAKGAAHQAAKKAQSTADVAAGKAKGTANVAAGKAKGTAEEVKRSL